MRRKLPLLFGATFLAFAVAACEGPEGPAGPAGPQGPQGPAGEAGAPGENALNTCSDCHSSDATIVAIEQQFESSPHGPANFSRVQAGSCAMCHTSQGFVAAATGEEADFSGGLASINCRTCHQIHMDYVADDFALTTTDPVTLLLTGNTVDVAGDDTPGSNLCATCHQARPEDVWPDYTAPLTQLFEITSTHFDLHHGPQTNMYTTELVEGFTFGVTASGPFGPHVDVSCNGCHMGLGVGEFMATPAPGGELGHNFAPSEDVCENCHDADFNYGGVQADVMAMTEELGACLEAEGVIVVEDGEWEPVVGEHPEPFVAAYLVFAGVEEDGSWGVHQPRYVPSLVEAALTFMEANSALCPVAVP